MDILKALASYLACALWTATDSDGSPLDREFDVSDFDPDAVKEAKKQIADFIGLVDGSIENSDRSISDEQFGHDFWLTRNGHGCGFWDRGHGRLGDYLTAMCKPYGEAYVYVGDDGGLYVTT